MYGAGRRGRWQIASAGWWPRPRRVQEGRHNAGWELRRCDQCSEWEARLITVARVEEGEELEVDDDQCIMGTRGRAWPLEMTFDGGAREINGRR